MKRVIKASKTMSDKESRQNKLYTLQKFLNHHTNEEWDINEMYTNCVICDSYDEEDYIEVFVESDGYRIGNETFQTLQSVLDYVLSIFDE